jgi:hypothetical protein
MRCDGPAVNALKGFYLEAEGVSMLNVFCIELVEDAKAIFCTSIASSLVS